MRIVSLTSFYQPAHLILMLIALTILGANFDGGVAHGQELRKAVRDYRDDRVFDYRASDPQHRGKAFNVHTGHYGKFYNCDGEEAKRNSQHICWKPHHENDFPPCLGFCENLRRDIAEIKQRISDGGCGTSCACNECQPKQYSQPVRTSRPVNQTSCPCAQCAMSGGASSNTIASSARLPLAGSKNLSAVDSSCDCLSCKLKSNASKAPTYRALQSTTAPKTNLRSTELRNHNSKSYGLVSGKIFRPTIIPQRTIVARTSFDQNDLAPRLPLNKLVQAPVLPPSDSPPSLTTTLKNKADSNSATKVQPPRSQVPRVVERTDFWNQYKVF